MVIGFKTTYAINTYHHWWVWVRISSREGSFLIIFVGNALHYYIFAELCPFIRYTETECLHSHSIFLLLNFYMKNLVAIFSLQKIAHAYQR